MRAGLLIAAASLTLLLLPCSIVHGRSEVEYAIQVENDGSASWVIRQTGTDIQVSSDTLIELQGNVSTLVVDARNKTQRDMDADVTSITSTVSGSYVAAEYRFHWSNFTKIENSSLIVGDVFQVEDLFLRLYGDGKVFISYPSGYSIESISGASPYERNDSLRTLEWLGTANFRDGLPTIILKQKPPDFWDILSQNAISVAGLLVVITGSFLSLLAFKRYKKKEGGVSKEPQKAGFLGVESDEERILNLLKSSGGSLRQSVIVDQCRFSKAKTSQLLTLLESKGTIRRFKKGRDKVVTLTKHGEA